MDGEPDPQTSTARHLMQRYLMDVADCITAGVVELAEILRMLMHGTLALIETSGLDPMELAMDQGFIEAYSAISKYLLQHVELPE